MRTYLVVIDESDEAQIALRFAARRAVKTGGGVEILSLIPKPDFVQWGGVMATIEDEARQLTAEVEARLSEARRLTAEVALRREDEARRRTAEVVARRCCNNLCNWRRVEAEGRLRF